MKKLILLASFATALGASAQYFPDAVGTEMSYRMVAYNEGDSVVVTDISKIESVETGKKGIVTIAYSDRSYSDSDRSKMHSSTGKVLYNPADSLTTFIIKDAEEAKKETIEMIKMMMEQMGQYASPADIEEASSSINVRGELSVAISPSMAVGTKMANKTIRVSMGTETATTNLWEGKIAEPAQITVPAGTFDCVILTYTLRTSSSQGTEKLFVTDAYAKGVGLVEETVKDKNGNIITRQQLIDIRRP